MKKAELLKALREAQTDNEKLALLITHTKKCNVGMFSEITLENIEEVYETAINHLKPYDNGFCMNAWVKSIKEKGLVA